jgi:hypothetical protein
VNLLLQYLKITKRRRTAYDHYMLKLHDRMKSDAAYLAHSESSSFDFPAGTSWMVFTDQVPHAAMRGSCAFEQTFYVPVESMANPSASPLQILERLTSQRLLVALLASIAVMGAPQPNRTTPRIASARLPVCTLAASGASQRARADGHSRSFADAQA